MTGGKNWLFSFLKELSLLFKILKFLRLLLVIMSQETSVHSKFGLT